MRAYVTGASGFVGSWLTEHLAESGDDVIAAGSEVDVTVGQSVLRSIAEAEPDAVYHLAGVAHVGKSWQEPEKTLLVNTIGTLHVLEAAASLARPATVLYVGSAEVYGAAGDAPVDEMAALRPVSPYAASKAAAELLCLQAHLGRSLPVIVTRPFNHVGPGQSPDFVVSALARRVVNAERAGGGEVAVGNLDPQRDFTDVRDVVRAYRLLVEHGEPGEAYNVASGQSMSVRALAERLASLASAELSFVVDPALARPVDIPVFVGDSGKLFRATGWLPEFPLEKTLADVLDYWRAEPSP
jgi:GDP-4-dehydro-6-deoxy-D-mannose reductase